MHQAAAMSPDDARHLVYRAAEGAIEGGQAGLLRPERRREVLRLATRQGMRPFDANLVIAIAQDAARRGESAASPALRQRLDIVPALAPTMQRGDFALRMLAISLGLAIAALGGFIAWIRQG
jgi:hypothetical protein